MGRERAMEKLPKSMTRVLTFSEMNEEMHPAFRPVQGLRAALYEEDYPFSVRRLSAFPTFATSYEQLMELLASIAGREEIVEQRFLELCRTLASDTRCYQIPRAIKPESDVYENLVPSQVDRAFVTALCREDSADLLMPDKALVLCGHDDFGCNVLTVPGDSQSLAWLRQRAVSTGLYLLEPPAS